MAACLCSTVLCTVSASSLPRIALLVAGGTGTRMGADVPKQFLPLAGQPVLLHTLRRFAEAAPDARLLVVLPADQHAYWQELLTAHADVPPHQVVAGGTTRLASVQCGLAALVDVGAEALVAIHDGVRPLVAVAVIQESYRVAAERGSAVAAVVLKDSLRRMTSAETSASEDRAAFRLVQTPQTFPLGTLRRAYAAIRPDDPALTDDASVVERLGQPITLIPGDYANLKITTPEDLVVAEALLRR